MMKGEQRGETDQLKARLEMLHRRGEEQVEQA